jgi:endonuclease III
VQSIVDLYLALKQDPRLQKNWEANQPRIDRALESPLIARTPREVATAALLVMKIRCEPAAATCPAAPPDADLIAFARTQGPGGSRLANAIEAAQDDLAVAAATATLMYYRDRSASNLPVKTPWSADGLKTLAQASPSDLIHPSLRPTWSERKAVAASSIAKLIVQDCQRCVDQQLRIALQSIPGLGPERADAVAVFAFHRAWPIVDEYLWRLLDCHGLLDEAECSTKRYDSRRSLFEPAWQDLIGSVPEDPNEIAATLYLWADEASRFGFRYEI